MGYQTWFRRSALRISMAAAGLFLVAAQVHAQVTYVEAAGGVGGNTVRASNDSVDDWFVTDTNSTDQKWNFRSAQGSSGVFQSSDSSTVVDDAPELKTTLSGLTDALYDVYAFYRSDPTTANDWKIRAGFTSNPGANTLYARTTAGGAIAGKVALSGPDALTFAGTAPTESGQPLLYAIIGQVNVVGGTLSVFIDDTPTTLPSPLTKRTWYEGIGYAIPSVTLEIDSIQTGNAQTATTWSNSLSPSPSDNYNVVNSHVVTVNQPFTGKKLTVKSGGSVDLAASGVDIRYLKVEAGGALTESVSGDFKIGDEFAALSLGFLELEADVTFNADPGADFILAASLLGTGSLNFNSNGPGSELILPDTSDHDGVVRFNGTGDAVRVVDTQPVRRIEMNSTGANQLIFNTTDQINGGVLIFNQAGVLDHASTAAGSRLINPTIMEANATVTVDLTKTYSGDERRMAMGEGIRGPGDIVVNGTATDPADPGGGSNGTTLNEFEMGGTAEPAGDIPGNTFAGTLTANNYVNVEIRRSMVNARVVVNQNALLDTGHQVVNTAKAIVLGEVQVNNGGTLEVGYTQTNSGGVATGHHVSHLDLVNTGTRAGSLTLADGSTTVMQVNGTDFTHHDTIDADGAIALNGTLNILVNPVSTTDPATPNPVYAPTLGDVITIMTSTAGSLSADFNDSGTVDGADLTEWRGAFGATAVGDADGDLDSDGADFLAWQRQLGSSAGGAISGAFDAVVVTDPGNVMATAGLAFNVQVTSSQVNLVVVAAGGVAAIPEPAGLLLATFAALGMVAVRRRRVVE